MASTSASGLYDWEQVVGRLVFRLHQMQDGPAESLVPPATIRALLKTRLARYLDGHKKRSASFRVFVVRDSVGMLRTAIERDLVLGICGEAAGGARPDAPPAVVDVRDADIRPLAGHVVVESLCVQSAKSLAAMARKCRQENDFAQNGPVVIQEARRLVLGPRPLCIMAIDIEAWERDQSVILEVGLCSLYSHEPEQTTAIHYIIGDHQRAYRNGRYVEDNMDCFDFGASERVEMQEALSRVRLALAKADVLVGHSLRCDLEYLQRAGVTVPSKLRTLDTQTIYKYLSGDRRPASLETLLKACEIGYHRLHNAGNDAHYTLAVLRAMLLHQ